MMNLQEFNLPRPPATVTRHSDGDSVGDNNEEEKNTDDPYFSWTTFLSYAGPGCLIAIAYLDPGNLEADLQVKRV